MSRPPEAGERRRLLALAAVFAVAALCGLAFHATGIGHGVERDALDARFDLRGADIDRSASIVIVGVDATTYGNLRPYPFSRLLHAKVIRRLHDAGAKLIAYDISFTQRKPGTAAVLGAAKAARPVVFSTRDVARDGYTPILGGPDKLR